MLIDEGICTEKSGLYLNYRGSENRFPSKPDIRTNICYYRTASLLKNQIFKKIYISLIKVTKIRKDI